MKTAIRGRPTRRRTVTKGRVGFVAVALIIATTALVIHNLDSDQHRKPVVTALQASTQTVPSAPPKTRSALPGWTSPTKKDDDNSDKSDSSGDSGSKSGDDSGDSGDSGDASSGKSDSDSGGSGKSKSKKSNSGDSSSSEDSSSKGSSGSSGSSGNEGSDSSSATPLSETPSSGTGSGTSGTGPKVQPGPVSGSANTTPSTGTTTGTGTTGTGSTGTGNNSGNNTGSVPNNQVLANPGRATASVPVTSPGTTGSQMMPVQCTAVSQAQLPAAVAEAAPGTVFCLNEAPQAGGTNPGTNLGTTNALPTTPAPSIGSNSTQVSPPAPLSSVSVPSVSSVPVPSTPPVTVPQSTQSSSSDSTSGSTSGSASGSNGSSTSVGTLGSSNAGSGGQCVNLSFVAGLLHSIFGGGTTRGGADGSTTVCGNDDGEGSISTNTVNGTSVPPGVTTDSSAGGLSSGSESSSGQSSSSSSGSSTSDSGSTSGSSEQAKPSSTQTTSQSGQGGGKPLKIWLTGYSFQDNTPPGSATVSHPIVHQKAGGTGTYTDPITVASPGSSDNMAFKPGAKFYLPSVKRYVIVEDSGASPAPSGTDGHLDMWVDGQGGSKSSSDACMNRITSNSATAIADPPPNEPVMAGPITSNGTCHIPGSANTDARRS